MISSSTHCRIVVTSGNNDFVPVATGSCKSFSDASRDITGVFRVCDVPPSTTTHLSTPTSAFPTPKRTPPGITTLIYPVSFRQNKKGLAHCWRAGCTVYYAAVHYESNDCTNNGETHVGAKDGVVIARRQMRAQKKKVAKASSPLLTTCYLPAV